MHTALASALPSHDDLRGALREAQQSDNGGLGFHMSATVVDRTGMVVAVAFSGQAAGDQWPGSRIISAQKANTSNGGLGCSGDYSCGDHNIAWKVRHILELDYVPSGVDPVMIAGKPKDNNIVFDIDESTGKSASGWGHPACPGRTRDVGLNLPATHPTRVRGAR